jgi:hypothetical protein
MGIEIVVCFADPVTKKSAALAQAVTGLPAYHAALVDRARDVAWDMNLIARSFIWSQYHQHDYRYWFNYYTPPVNMTAEWLDHLRMTDKDRYGVMDYAAWPLRKVAGLIGVEIPDFPGRVCSGKVVEWLSRVPTQQERAVFGDVGGWVPPSKWDILEPSPADLDEFFRTGLV